MAANLLSRMSFFPSNFLPNLSHLCPDLNSVPALDKIAQSSINHALLLENCLALESRRCNIDGVHAPATTRDVLDEQFGRGELLGQNLGNGSFGGAHRGKVGFFLSGSGESGDRG
jgi:hypothetical protein